MSELTALYGWLQAYSYGGLDPIAPFIRLKGKITKDSMENQDAAVFKALQYVFLAAFAGFKAWEMLDAWILPSHYKKVREESPLPPKRMERLFAKKEIKYISKEAYVTAGALALMPGFGAGHAILGKYRQKGWIFTASEAAAFAGLIFAYRIQFDEKGQASLWGHAAALIMQTAFMGLKVWEAADVWNLPPHYKVVPHVPDMSRMQIQPAGLGLALSYRF